MFGKSIIQRVMDDEIPRLSRSKILITSSRVELETAITWLGGFNHFLRVQIKPVVSKLDESSPEKARERSHER